MNVNNRWFQLVASLIAMIMIANLQYAWTLFVQPLQAGTGWKLSDIQFAFTLFILFQTWVQPLDGWPGYVMCALEAITGLAPALRPTRRDPSRSPGAPCR